MHAPLYTKESKHAPAGGATYPFVDYHIVVKVSIHAPAGGATVIVYFIDTQTFYY